MRTYSTPIVTQIDGDDGRRAILTCTLVQWKVLRHDRLSDRAATLAVGGRRRQPGKDDIVLTSVPGSSGLIIQHVACFWTPGSTTRNVPRPSQVPSASRKTDRLHLITGGILGTLRDLRKYLAGLGVDDGYKACSSRYDGVQETEA